MGDLNSKNVLGDFKVSERAIATIAETAAIEIPGVAGMANFTTNVRNFKNVFRGGTLRPTRVRLNEEAIGIDLCIKVFAGFCLKDLAKEVQKNVKEAVQNMTGLVVSFVNVTIAGVCVENEDGCSCGCTEGSECDCDNCPEEVKK